MGYRVFVEQDYRRYFQNVKSMVSRLNERGDVRRLSTLYGSWS